MSIPKKSYYYSYAPYKTAHILQYAILFALRKIPSHLCKSITYDNGSECMYHTQINTGLNTRSYFYSSYCAGESINGTFHWIIPLVLS